MPEAKTTYPRITVVTVNYNLAPYLDAAMRSVLDQNYPNLEYIVIDGGSTDGSREIIESYAEDLAFWSSEPDDGQYDAVAKGFARATGDIMCWLNSDDMLQRGALQAVAEVFTTFPDVRWATGIAAEYSPEGSIIQRITLPWCRWSQRRYLTFDFQFIQQESTFWRRDLWEEAGGRFDSDLKLAGDMELWARFFRHAKLHTVQALLGGFRYRREGQRSTDQRMSYLQECDSVVRRERKLIPWQRRMWLPFLRGLGWPIGLPFLLQRTLPSKALFGLVPIAASDQLRFSQEGVCSPANSGATPPNLDVWKILVFPREW